MKDLTLFRYSPHEKVASKRLCNLFNQTRNENVSFNRAFPRLMSQFMEKHPQYGLCKRSTEDGIYYFGIGVIIDPIKEKRPPLTKKEKNDRQRLKNIG